MFRFTLYVYSYLAAQSDKLTVMFFRSETAYFASSHCKIIKL